MSETKEITHVKRPELKKIKECLWELAPSGAMRVPVRLVASDDMLDQLFADNAPQQAANVACLPGICVASFAMPDMHWGYGFPIGGVAAFDLEDGVISPGGVGYDINCGVRLMASRLSRDDVSDRVSSLTDALFNAVPSGVGSSGATSLTVKELKNVARNGANWAVEQGFGTDDDCAHIEENGCMPEADVDAVSKRAWERGRDQVGTLGAGNHFLEVGVVDRIFDERIAKSFGLAIDQITLMIHCGSRGFGHQICDDYLGTMRRAADAHSIDLPDRQLACAPIPSEPAQRYLGAMNAAINYAFANRQVIAHFARTAFSKHFGGAQDAELRTVYEVAHNIAKIESHTVDGNKRRVCVHRKGATRAFGPGHNEVPADYRDVGQPVLIPGDMGTSSHVLAGTETAMTDTFGSACHGAGRTMSRRKARDAAKGRDIVAELRSRGVVLRARSKRTVGEEMSHAYKDVSHVVDTCQAAGIATKVARIRPLGVIKG